MVHAAIVLSAGIIAGTIAYTAVRYRALPARVPLHFGITGLVDGTGPRPAVWLLVVAQFVLGAMYLGVSLSGAGHRSLWVGCLTVALLAWMQVQIVSVAIAGTNRLPAARFWIALTLFLVGTVVITALGR